MHHNKLWVHVGNFYASSFSGLHESMKILKQSKNHYYAVIENAGNDISKIRGYMNDSTLLYFTLHDRIDAMAVLSVYDDNHDQDIVNFHSVCILDVMMLVDVTEISMIKLRWPQIKLRTLESLPDRLNYTEVLGHDPIRTIL